MVPRYLRVVFMRSVFGLGKYSLVLLLLKSLQSRFNTLNKWLNCEFPPIHLLINDNNCSSLLH